jgi:hypothetical protein
MALMTIRQGLARAAPKRHGLIELEMRRRRYRSN